MGYKTMKKILLADYYGTCNEDGTPIGHSPKVLQEYCDLLKDEYTVGAALSPCLVKTAKQKFYETVELKYDIREFGRRGLWKRIIDKLKLFYNIHQVLQIKQYDVIWFYRTDFFLFLYFCFRRKQNEQKVVALVYQEVFGQGKLGRILSCLYHRGALKIDGLIYARNGMAKFHPHTTYLPDYSYSEEKYHKYRQAKKREKVVCPGTMNPYKKLEDMVEAFNVNGISLEIKGYFYDKARFHRLLELKRENIVIEDVILSEEEYYGMIAGAKYCILPYDMEQYAGRTSGVLQESVFLNTIPIAPSSLLSENQIQGIGYENIMDLGTKWTEMTREKIDNSPILEEYDRTNIRDRLIEFMDRI